MESSRRRDRTKGIKTVTAISSLGNAVWGVAMQEARTIYRGVAIPQMIYASSAWSNQNWTANRGTIGTRTLNKPQSLQARGVRTISGAYRATSIPTLNIETYLLPIEEQILKNNIDTIGRIGPAAWPQANAPGTGPIKRSPRQTIEQTIHDLNGPDIHLQEQISP